MRNYILILLFALIVPVMLSGQDSDEKYTMLEDVYIQPKVGHQAALEDAIKAHNAKYHTEAPYEAELYYIAKGKNAGWYVWEMGPTTYTEMDGRPTNNDGHDADWDNNVIPHVQQYGNLENWRMAKDLSVSNDREDDKFVIWYIDIKRGDNYRFRSVVEKVRKVYEAQGEEMTVWYNEWAADDGREACIAWPFENWAEFDKDDWKMKDEFEKIHGPGSWQQTLDDWDDCVESRYTEVWLEVK